MSRPASQDAASPSKSELLCELRADSEVVSADLREWWGDYLHSHASHYLNLLTLVEGCPGVRSVLDVGNFPVLMPRLGLDVANIDIDPDRAGDHWARHHIQERQADIEFGALPFDDESFDVVVLGEVRGARAPAGKPHLRVARMPAGGAPRGGPLRDRFRSHLYVLARRP